MITVESLTKKYGAFTAVDDVTFTARPGRVTGFLGPNGAGKSTTMRDHGRPDPAHLRHRHHLRPPVRRPAQPRASRSACCSTPRRSTPAAPAARSSPSPSGPWACRPAGSTRCSTWSASPPTEADRRVRNYSLGMRQRLGIATALIGDPEVLILDEPANGLDPAGIRWMRDLLRGYADRGGTVLLSSHLLHEIEVIADDLVVIGNGRIVAQGTKAELLQAAGTVVRAADPAAPGRGRSPRAGRRRHGPAATAPCAPTPTPSWSARSRSRPASPSPSCAPPTAPGSRRCSSSSPPTPNEKEQQHEPPSTVDRTSADHAPRRPRRIPLSPGRRASSCARCSTPGRASG